MGKIIVLGDSLAYGKWDQEGGWVTRLRKYIDEKYNIGKSGNFQVYNLGIPGDVVINLQNRVEPEIKSRQDKLTNKYLVIYAIGINDSCPNNRMTAQQTPENEFKNAYKKLIAIAKNLNCQIACLGLTPVNPRKLRELKFTNEQVRKYDQYITQVCQEMSVSKLELFYELQKQNFSSLLVDSVHPNNEGHKILLNYILKFLNDQNFLNYLRVG